MTRHLIGLTKFIPALLVIGCGGMDPDAGKLQQGSHAWGSYHWARTSNPFTIKLGDNLTSQWKSYLGTTSSDWSKSTVLDTTIVAGQSTSKRCSATSGRVEVCNASYGQNGWLGVASISVSGSHITAGTVKLNDTYFSMSQYNSPAWRNLVTCQEVGHTFGLAHQDENFNNANLNTCMDYTNSPDSNQHPNTHDYDMLQTIYSHNDSTTTIGAALPLAQGAFVGEFGRLLESEDHSQTYILETGPDSFVLSHVLLAE